MKNVIKIFCETANLVEFGVECLVTPVTGHLLARGPGYFLVVDTILLFLPVNTCSQSTPKYR